MALDIHIDGEEGFLRMLVAVGGSLEIEVKPEAGVVAATEHLITLLGQAYGFTGRALRLPHELSWLPTALGPACLSLHQEEVRSMPQPLRAGARETA